MKKSIFTAVAVALAAAAPTSADKETGYSPYASQNFPDNVYWGDTHVHTALSHDANPGGAYKLGPQDAYRIARGETIIGNLGEKVALIRPLDFLVVADHAEMLGVIQAVWNEDARLISQPDGDRWLQIIRAASKDPDGANLERIQLVKGWLEAQIQERAYTSPVWYTPGREPTDG